MAKIGFFITADKPDDVSGRAWRAAMVAGWFAVGMYHDEQVQPRKFAADAASRYQFQPRSAKYLQKKKKLAKASWRVKDGGERELVYSGMTRTITLRKQYPRAFPTRVWVEIPTPSYVQMRPKASRWKMPALGQELVSITPDEHRDMEVVFQQAVIAELDRRSERRRIRV
jgi:hypothetical protein